MDNMKKTKIFVIILNYNGKDTLRECLDSVFKVDYPGLEIVLVDNNSVDGSFEDMKKRFSKVHFIKNSENLGFSAGNNVGIRFALERMADYVFLLNNDAWVNENTFPKLMEFTDKHPGVGVVSPLILKPDHTIWFSGGEVDWFRMRARHTSSNRINSDYVTGCAMLIRKDVFSKIGLFDEDFFLYYEDVDFCTRAKNVGFGVKIARDAVVCHREMSEISNLNKIYWLVLSGLVFFKKNTPRSWRLWMRFYLYLRKRKNKRDIKKNINKKTALKVQKAYQDAENFLKD